MWPSNTLNSTYTSRNPEDWLTPFNYGGTNTGTVMGKFTDANGNPVGDRYIWGLSKPAGSGSTTYVTSRTYAYSWTIPDDSVVENWATTDVLPGGYTLTVKNAAGTPVAGPTPVVVEAGRTTYAGLYPFYLPEVRQVPGVWNTTVSIRNKGSSAASVTTTFFNASGYTVGQSTDTLAVNGSISYLSPTSGSALVVGSQDLAVSVITDNGTEAYAYTAIPHNSSPSGIGIGTTLYAPNTLNNYYGWHSDIYVQNTTGTSTSVSYQYYNTAGSPAGNGSVNLPPWGQAYIPRGPQNGWVRLSSAQPIAGVLKHYRTNPANGQLQYMAYPLANSGGTVGHMPSLLRQYYTWNSAYLTTNLGGASTAATTNFRPPATARNYNLPGYGHYQEYLDGVNPPVPAPFAGSGYTTAGGTIVTAAQHSNDGTAMGMHGVRSGATRVDLPLLRNGGAGNWTGSLVIQNLHPFTSTNATITLYNTAGGQVWQGTVGPISPYYSTEVRKQAYEGSLPNEFEGSVVVTASTNIAVNVQQSINNDRGYAYAQP